MKKQLLLLFLSGTFLLSACQTQPTTAVEDISIESKLDRNANLANYKTYTWLATAEILIDPDKNLNAPGFNVEEHITTHVNKEMKKQGLTESEKSPDLYLSYVLGVNMDRLKLKADPDTGMMIKKNVPKGELLITFIDAKTQYVVWVASAHAGVKNAGTETTKIRLQYAIEEMFKKLPKS
ncbi:MAG: DUF4136 domain-containing protein [Thiohalomonadales bacterium]